MVKGGHPAYGYKIHGVADEAHGFILGGHATAAQVSDPTELPQVLEEAGGVPSGLNSHLLHFITLKNSAESRRGENPESCGGLS